LLADEVERAIMANAVLPHERYGQIFAYEVDGYGNRLFIDDANAAQSGLDTYVGFVPATNPIYRNTRAFALSDANPYFASARPPRVSAVRTPERDRFGTWPDHACDDLDR